MASIVVMCCILFIFIAKCTTYSTYTIDCKTEHCRHSYIDCLPNQDCFVLCDEPESCLGATITCPLEADCEILCKGGESCRDTIINATLQLGNLNLRCEQSTDHCRDIKVYGSILDKTNNDFSMNISCNGKQRSCVNSHIICPLNSNCDISCLSDTSCRWSQIIGPINGNLNIKCLGINSCFDSIFDGSQSQIFSINGCKADKSCLDLTFYCPPNTNGHKNCFIEGNNNIGRDNAKGISIYAINGWNDIYINYYGTYTSAHSGTMFCGNDYGITCEIDHNDWTCSNKNDYCNFYNEDTTLHPCDRSHYNEDDETDCFNSDDTITITNIPTIQPSIMILDIIDTTTEYQGKNYEIINMEQGENNYNENTQHKYETVLWTTDTIIGLVGMVMAVILFIIGMYCCYRIHKNLKTSEIKSKKSDNDKQKNAINVNTKKTCTQIKKKIKLQSNYKCIDIDIDDDNDDDFKIETLDDIQNTIQNLRNTEGLLDPYSPKNDIFEKNKIVNIGTYGLSMSNDIMNSDANSHIQSVTPQITDNKMEIIERIIPELRKESNVTPTVSNNTGNASSNDINERNILFLNPPSESLHVNKRKTTHTQSNETSVSIQTNYDESSLSYDMYASPIKPHTVHN